MTGFRPLGQVNSGIERAVLPTDLMLGGENILTGALATAGDGTWTAAMITSGIIRRTGPVGGYTDTTDTATNIIAALAGNNPAADVVPGTTFRMLLINTVAQALTFAAGVGVVAGTGTVNVAASLVREYLFTVLNAQAAVTIQSATTNASKVVTWILPSGRSALVQGPNGTNNVSFGASVSGTGITAGTTVAGVTAGVGGTIGVTLSANATATSAAGGVALTFGPSVQVDGIRSSTL